MRHTPLSSTGHFKAHNDVFILGLSELIPEELINMRVTLELLVGDVSEIDV